MAITTYSELKSAVASWMHRGDLTSVIPDFIALAEADLRVRAKLSEWETTATVSLTSGSGSLPSDTLHVISVTYGAGDYLLDFAPTRQVDAVNSGDESGEPVYYTITGTTLKVGPLYTGDVTVRYMAKFASLSDSATTNSLLTLFPDAYLHGSLMHASDYIKADQDVAKYGALFDRDIARIRTYMLDYKYPDGLQMRVA